MNDDLPPALAQILEGELAPGERILWRARPSLIHLIEFQLALVLCGLVVLITIGGGVWILHLRSLFSLVDAHLAHLMHLLELLLILIVALTPLIPILIWRNVRHTVYAVTDRRAILIHAAILRRRIQSFTGEQLVRIVRNENRQGRGDIYFERRIGFLGLTNAKAVAELLRQTYQATHPV